MKNQLKEYLGASYTNDHLRNFCLYWLKEHETMPRWDEDFTTEERQIFSSEFDAWRAANDLDCLYYDGDMRADTLFSAWTPIRWVANCLNKDKDIRFYKWGYGPNEGRYLEMLANDHEKYLSSDHGLVQLLYRFLELAEQPCNYMLLPDRGMNQARYKMLVEGRELEFYDEVPAMLYHIFRKETLGRYFLDENVEVDKEAVAEWIQQEHLEMGFVNGQIGPENVIPLIRGLNPANAKRLTDEVETAEALRYMIAFLEKRKAVLEGNA